MTNSKNKLKIAIITGSRAEWGHLSLLYSKLSNSDEFQTEVIATGSHLAKEFGHTADEILLKSNTKLKQIPILHNKNTDIDICMSLANCFEKIPEVLQEISPDLLVLLGDRYEVFAAATVARTLNIPIAHISGGEITLGALDDCFRHSITKLSSIHFTASERYRKRVIQLGEHPDTVFNVGDLGVSDLNKIQFLQWDELKIPLDFNHRTFLITLHPETLSPGKVLSGLDDLFAVLDSSYSDVNLIFTGANADPEGLKINSRIKSYVNQDQEMRYFTKSLGRIRYLSTANLSTIVIGNSSSGLIEVPSLKTVTINIGDRQKGRDKALSVLDCEFTQKSIQSTIIKGLELSQNASHSDDLFSNPYFGGDTAGKIVDILKSIDFEKLSTPKAFYDL